MPRRALWYRNLSFQVLLALGAAILFGILSPELAMQCKVLGDAYVRLIKMVIGPVIFVTIVTGIAASHDLRKVGRVGVKALIYFELMTTLALGIGLVVAHLTHPGQGIDVAKVRLEDVQSYVGAAKSQSLGEFFLHLIPEQVVGAFASGDILQIVVFAVFFGAALSLMGPRGLPLHQLLTTVGEVFFKIVGLIMRAAPIGTFGAMAFTVGKFGVEALSALAKLMASVYLSMFLFIAVGLGLICRAFGFRLWPLLKFIKEEILLVLGTSSSESALPGVMGKLTAYGCEQSIVGLVVPTGYSFNLDGTAIYLFMAALFIAQAYGTQLSWSKEALLFGLLMVTSKGAATVAGGGFVTLAATLSATGVLPVEGVALLLGVDRFMSEARAITNLIGNSVATVVIAKLERSFHPPATALPSQSSSS